MKNSSKKGTATAVPTEPPIDHNASNGGQTQKHMMPVRRKRRDDWCIPRINEQQLRQAEQQELKDLQELLRGTTPTGRRLYSMINYGITNKLGQPGTTIGEVVSYAQSEFATFPSLEWEFKQQFCKISAPGSDPSISLGAMATILVFKEARRLGLLKVLVNGRCEKSHRAPTSDQVVVWPRPPRWKEVSAPIL